MVSVTGTWYGKSLSSHYGGAVKYASAKDQAASFTFTEIGRAHV